MKNLLTATLPALALLALGGCATTGALTTSTENDGVYYSSKDHTTVVGSPGGVYSGNGTIPAKALDDTAPATAATTEDANPDYQGGTTAQAASGSDYYNDSYSSYSSGFGQPYTGPGVSSFNYSPSANYAVSPSYYGSPYGYASAFGYGYSPFSLGYGYGLGGFGYPYGGFYDPFYSSFYSPFGYGFGSGLSIGFGYGFGGFGGFGYPYGGFGYPYGYGASYYDTRGYGGYNRPVIYANGTRVGSGANPVLVGPRGGRGGAVMNNATAANPNAVNNVNGRRAISTYSTGGVAAPTPTYSSATGQPAYDQSASKAGRGATNFGNGQVVGQPTYSTPGATAGQTAGAVPQAPQNAGRRGFFGGFFGNGSNSANPAGGTTTDMNQTMQRRSYSQPQYSNSAGTQQRSYSQPQPTYSQPTYSQPSRSFGGGNFGGGGGGGSFGGGGGGGRRGGR